MSRGRSTSIEVAAVAVGCGLAAPGVAVASAPGVAVASAGVPRPLAAAAATAGPQVRVTVDRRHWTAAVSSSSRIRFVRLMRGRGTRAVWPRIGTEIGSLSYRTRDGRQVRVRLRMLRKQRPHRWVVFARGDISVVVSDTQTFISARFVSGVRSPRIAVRASSLVPTGACRVAVG